MDPQQLFSEDLFGNRSNFFETLKLQNILESCAFEQSLMDRINQSANDEVEIPTNKFRKAIVDSDHNKSRNEVNRLLARGCECTGNVFVVSLSYMNTT